MGYFEEILARARALDAAAGSPTLIMLKLDEAKQKPVTLSSSDLSDLEVFMEGLLIALENCRRGS